ncbi:MAG: family 1 glycosylhydrolase, partial [Nitrososphaeraceae archaeon]
TVDAFIKYVSKMVNEFKDIVDYWITLSEPVASVVGIGYIAGIWPPGFVLDGGRAKIALHNLIEVHVQAYDKITAIDNIDSDGDGISEWDFHILWLPYHQANLQNYLAEKSSITPTLQKTFLIS